MSSIAVILKVGALLMREYPIRILEAYSHTIGIYKPNQMFQICLWCTQILFNKIEPVEGQDLLKEIMILNRVSGSVWKSVIRLRGLDDKDRDVEF